MFDLLGDKRSINVLLAGEGNFSFTVALLKKCVNTSYNIISTCYQTFRQLSSEGKLNAKLANKLGNKYN